MSIPRIKADLHGHIDELFSADLPQSSDLENQAALEIFLVSTYSSLASLAWHMGADGSVLQREAVPAAELVEEAFFERRREREFSPGGTDRTQRLLGTHNHRQQFGGSFR
ncbi:hypothetical protein SJ05684_c20560 [Sinorhizobium sojae CCBAU 05684]|uniref:Uncharacterized protein n=1 Tax=Sinorhizobium sojae CCBAU 05684 TaxID=716928 RepID=A0A249PC54_9HYPH|nr:hypothetical protein [Sinorhizobium sojae]ASY63498.1 hypothetical protein SJ05684_c20560 [Sinorhizobium sojae CCBAU 05684]